MPLLYLKIKEKCDKTTVLHAFVWETSSFEFGTHFYTRMKGLAYNSYLCIFGMAYQPYHKVRTQHRLSPIHESRNTRQERERGGREQKCLPAKKKIRHVPSRLSRLFANVASKVRQTRRKVICHLWAKPNRADKKVVQWPCKNQRVSRLLRFSESDRW